VTGHRDPRPPGTGDAAPGRAPDGRGPVSGWSDEDLLAVLSTDAAAFTEFYRRHLPRVRTVGLRRLGTAEDVADMVASVFLKVIESADGFDPRRGRAVPWLHAVAANVAADERRRSGRATAAQARLQGRRFWDDADLARLEEQLDAAAAVRALATSIAELPDGERRLLELVAVDDLTPAEAAAVLGLRPGTARMRLSRARRHLQRHLQRATPSTTAPTVPLAPLKESR